LDHFFLDFLQDQLAFGQSETESFDGHTLPLDLGYILPLLVARLVDDDKLEAELHALPALRTAC
jgi:hypothetical protein